MENKKKILIVNNNMHIGGVQKSLVNLLNAIHDKYDVTLMLFSEVGDYLNDIPEDIKVIAVKSHYKYLGMSMVESRASVVSFLARSFYAALSKALGRKYAIALMNLTQKEVQGYDVAISFLQNSRSKSFYGGCNDFILDRVDAPRKAAFLHCDYVKCGANTNENAKRYSKFDVIAACSDGCRKVFVNALPELEEKTITVRNCHDFSSIMELAEQSPVVMDSEYINIVTVARLSNEKGVMRAIEAIDSLGAEKEKIRYYIVGDGPQGLEIKQKIEELNLSHIITMCGALANPYGYMKASDILLIPSYEEAAPMVIDEAASLGVPILSTLTSSAEDMVVKRNVGWVCENSTNGIIVGLENLIGNPTVIIEQKQKMLSTIYNNNEAIEQFRCMIG